MLVYHLKTIGYPAAWISWEWYYWLCATWSRKLLLGLSLMHTLGYNICLSRSQMPPTSAFIASDSSHLPREQQNTPASYGMNARLISS